MKKFPSLRLGSLLALPLGAALLAGCPMPMPLPNPNPQPAPPTEPKPAPTATPVPTATPLPTPVPKPKMSFYDFKLQTLDGREFSNQILKGRAVLVVNTASNCGFTSQYAGLQALSDKYKDKGLVVIGVPANDFGAQEPGSDAQIAQFCQKNYGVKFPMMSKTVVKGPQKSPFFQFLTAQANPQLAGEIGWNFEKFLVSRDGQLVSRFKSAVKPDSAELVAAVESELAKKSG